MANKQDKQEIIALVSDNLGNILPIHVGVSIGKENAKIIKIYPKTILLYLPSRSVTVDHGVKINTPQRWVLLSSSKSPLIINNPTDDNQLAR